MLTVRVKPICCLLLDYFYRLTKTTEYIMSFNLGIFNATYNFLVNSEELFGCTAYVII